MPNHIHGILIINKNTDNWDDGTFRDDIVGTVQCGYFRDGAMWIFQGRCNAIFAETLQCIVSTENNQPPIIID